MKWYPFTDIVIDVTSKFSKIKASAYNADGKFKIIDQGKDAIAGYTDDEALVNAELSPIIIFGDHTRVIKYEDTPIVLGADGAKALKVDSRLANTLYVYYYLRSVKVKAAGYSRHFKFLKEIQIPIPQRNGEPNFDDQIRITYLLGKVERLIDQRKQHLQQLGDLLKSVFLEMFGGCKEFSEMTIGDALSQKILLMHKDGNHGSNYPRKEDFGAFGIPFITAKSIDGYGRLMVDGIECLNEDKAMKLTIGWIEVGDVLLAHNATVGRVGYYGGGYEKALIGTSLTAYRPDHKRLNSLYLCELLRSDYFQRQLFKCMGQATRNQVPITAQRSLKIKLPPLKLQTQFAVTVEKVEGLKSHYQKNLADLENLYGALSRKAFKGELDLSRVPQTSKQPAKEEAIQTTTTRALHPKAIELPDPLDLLSLSSVEGRAALIGQWLDTYLGQLDRAAAFSTSDFMEAAQKRMNELSEDDLPEFGVMAYDQIKTWIFEALESGRLLQRYNDAGNRVQLFSAKD